MLFPKNIRVAVGAMTLAGSMSTGAHAAMLMPGFYALHNHPNGSANPPPYGLRLDGLLTGDADDTYTFDFDHPSSAMFLTLAETSPGRYTMTISGQAFGGRDTGTGYDATESGLVEVFFEYVVGAQDAPGDDDIVVEPDDTFDAQGVANTGSITLIGWGGDATIPLADKKKGDISFRFGDEDDDSGHRGFAGISGWGWLKHGDPLTNFKFSDWLFTAEKTDVPGPGPIAIVIAAACLGGARPARRR